MAPLRIASAKKVNTLSTEMIHKIHGTTEDSYCETRRYIKYRMNNMIAALKPAVANI